MPQHNSYPVHVDSIPTPDADPVYWGFGLLGWKCSPAERMMYLDRCWEEYHRLAETARMEALASYGRDIQQIEFAELDDMLIGPAVVQMMTREIPQRCENRARAAAVLDRLQSSGYLVSIVHGRLVAEPQPERQVQDQLDRFAWYICELLDEQSACR